MEGVEVRSLGESGPRELYERERSRLWRALLGYTADPEIASDAVSEAFAQACRTWSEIRSPAAWVWKVAFRVATKELRRRGTEARAVESAYEVDDRSLEVALALRRLPHKQRASVVLHYYGGYSTSEIGHLLGSSASAAAVNLHRARKQLGRILGDDDD